ncbi:DUF3090 domain-containing protein [Planctomonas psychrotolerans]|uniref:DUF3090 domain-containing protein n=1 Tax=Planctomonas psychrotolerans TaxID=2528712 RepID=UPI0012389E23|nr:DUF3090 domain-containing protein [Planctomonas psychrotolerans]
MPTIVHDFSWPDRVVVGTVGSPGSRAFYLQVRNRAQIISVALEKEQSAVLAVKIDEILNELMTNESNAFSIPATTPVELVDNDPLEQPLDTQFRTGAMSLGWDPSTAQVVVEAYPIVDDDDDTDYLGDDDDDGPAEVLRVRMPVGTARAFAKRTLEVVGSGRPLCPRCGDPMDPDGHTCPLSGDVG